MDFITTIIPIFNIIAWIAIIAFFVLCFKAVLKYLRSDNNTRATNSDSTPKVSLDMEAIFDYMRAHKDEIQSLLLPDTVSKDNSDE